MEKRLSISSFLRRCLYLLCFLAASQAKAQIPIGVNVNIFPPYPTQYNVWISDAANYIITINNTTDSGFDYYVRVGIEGNSGGEETYLRISDDFFPNQSLRIEPFEVVTITGADLEDLYINAGINDLDRSPNVPLEIDGELPEGTYQLCFEVMLYDAAQEVYLSPKICSEFFEIGHNDLQLVYPEDQSVWSETDIPVTFQWINNSSQNLSGNFTYFLELYELEPEQYENESIYEYVESGGAPFFVSEGVQDYSYIYDIDFGLPKFNEGYLYAARVMVKSESGSYYDNGGYSNISTFWFGHNPYEDGSGNDDEEEEVPIDCDGVCNIELPTNTTPHNSMHTLTSFSIGHFEVEDVQLFDMTPGITDISGTGEIQVDFLNEVKIKVEFENLIVNLQNLP